MKLFAYNQVGEPGELVIWVGVLGIAEPPAVAFSIAGVVVEPKKIALPFQPVGDAVMDAQGRALNQRAIFIFDWPETAKRFPILVQCGDQQCMLSSRRFPNELPTYAEGGFNLLLSSCYYQPNDKTEYNVGQLVKQIKPAPDFILLAGDQVYLDLPSSQNLPQTRAGLASAFGKKYQTNWFSRNFSQPGLADVLSHGPVMCIPDDHEYWNNFPYFQTQLNNTHFESDRNNWSELATLLYQQYQMAPVQKDGFFRQDIAPLSMLFLDARSPRDNDAKRLFSDAAKEALDLWKKNLLARKNRNQPAIGLLSSGQALLIDKPNWFHKRIADMEMVNYQDYPILQATLEQLISAGIPIIYITGDVHWGRIIEGKNPHGKSLLYEVIATPARLIDTVGADQISDLRNKFGEKREFIRHTPTPEQIPDTKLAGLELSIKHKQPGDHVALLRFHRIAGGIEMHVDYHCTDPDEHKRRKYTTTLGPYKITSL